MTNSTTRTCLAFACFVLSTNCAFGQSITISSVALEGDTAPEASSSYVGLGTPIINGEGAIAFTGDFLLNLPGRIDDGVWFQKPGEFTRKLVEGADESPFFLQGNDPNDFEAYGMVALLGIDDNGNMLVRSQYGIASGNTDKELSAFMSNEKVLAVDTSWNPAGFDLTGKLDGQLQLFFQGEDNFVPVLYSFSGGQETELARGGAPAGTTPSVNFDPANPFSSFVVTTQGELVLHAKLDPLGPGVDFTNGTALYKSTGNGLQLILRAGDPIPAEIATGTYALLSSSNIPQEPSVNVGGKIVFKAQVAETFQSLILETSFADAAISAVLKTGEPTATKDLGDVTFQTIGNRPFLNRSGDIYFSASTTEDSNSVWRRKLGQFERIVRAGQTAPGAGGAVFRSFPNLVANSQGLMAMIATLEFGGEVTTENDTGLWIQDEDENWTLVVREGTDLIVDGQNLGKILEIQFESNGQEGTGNDEGIPSGFSDNGDVTFFLLFEDPNQGTRRGIFRGAFADGSGENYFWNGAAGDNQWHSKSGGTTNWRDDANVQWTDPPGTQGKEIVTIDPAANVVLDQLQADIGKLTAKGSLEVRQDLFLAEDSTAESITLTNDADIWLRGKLSLGGANNQWLSGEFKRGGDDDGVLEILDTGTLTIPASPSETRILHAPWINNGAIVQNATILSETTFIGLFDPLKNFGLYTISNNANIESIKFTLEKDSTLIIDTGSQSRVQRIAGEGGSVTVNGQANLSVNRSEFSNPEGTTATTLLTVNEGGALTFDKLEEASLNGHFFNRDSDVIITGSGAFNSNDALWGFAANSLLAIRTETARLEDLSVSAETELGEGRIRFEKPAGLDTRPAVTITTSDNADPSKFIDVVVDNRADLTIENEVQFWGPLLNKEIGNLVLKNANIYSTDSVDSIDWFLLENAGQLTSQGTTILAAGSSDDVRNFGKITVSELSSFTIGGTSDISNNALQRGEWEVRSGGVAILKGNEQLNKIDEDAKLTLIGAGTFNDLPNSGAFIEFRLDGFLELRDGANGNFPGSFTVGEKGQLLLNNAALTTNDFVIEPGGFLGGRLNVKGPITSSGIVSSGESPGIGLIEGDYTQTAAGTLKTEIGGSEAGTGFDQLQVIGTANLAGTLDLSIIDDFEPTENERFEILTADSVIGQFDTIVWDDTAGEWNFEAEYETQSVFVRAFSIPSLTYSNWRASTFSPEEQADANISDPLANPDLDLWTNLEEYVFGFDPKTRDGAQAIKTVFINGSLTEFQFPIQPGIADAIFEIETSTNLIDWEIVSETSLQIGIGEDSRFMLPNPNPVGDESLPRFHRIRIQLQE